MLQGHLGLRAASRERRVEFYADLQSDSPGYRALFGNEPITSDFVQSPDGNKTRFWLALRAKDASDKTLFAEERAELANPGRRPPEPHPGLRRPGTPVGIRLTANNGAFFLGT